ncbi:MAG: PaaI family thioesterase [Alphaproteobacteria bacterium]
MTDQPTMPDGYAQGDYYDPFGDIAGPFWHKITDGPDGAQQHWFGLKIEERHLNSGARVHGGLTMTIADEALGAAAWHFIGDQPAVTVSLTTNFIGAITEGMVLEAVATKVSRGGSMVFVQGELLADGNVVANASGVWKILKGAFKTPFKDKD